METLASQLTLLPAGLSLPWEAAKCCKESGILSDFALYILSSAEYLSLSTASSALSCKIEQGQLGTIQPGSPFTVLDTDEYSSFFMESGTELDVDNLFSAPPKQQKAAKKEHTLNWFGYMSASKQLFLAAAPKDPQCLDGVLGEALAGLLDRQEQFIINHMHCTVIAKQKIDSAAELLLAESERRHTEWLALIVLQPKPLAKYLLDKYGDHAADGLAMAIQRLAASLIQPVGLAIMLSGGRLLLCAFAHSKSDPQLIASQLIKNFRKLYACDPNGSQAALETNLASKIQTWRSELPLPELSAYCVAENKAGALADCLAELY